MSFKTLKLVFDNLDTLEFPSSNIEYLGIEQITEAVTYCNFDGLEKFKVANFVYINFNHLANKPNRNKPNEIKAFDRITAMHDLVEIVLLDQDDSVIDKFNVVWKDGSLNSQANNLYQHVTVNQDNLQLELYIKKEND